MSIRDLLARLAQAQQMTNTPTPLPALPSLFNAVAPKPAAAPAAPAAPVAPAPAPAPAAPAPQQPTSLMQLIAAASQNAAGGPMAPVAPPPPPPPVQAPVAPSGPAAAALQNKPFSLKEALLAAIGLGNGGVMGDSDSPVVGGPSINANGLAALRPELRHLVEQNLKNQQAIAGGGQPSSAPPTPFTPPAPRLPTRPLFGGNPATLPPSFFNPSPLNSGGGGPNPAQLQALQQLMSMQQGMGGMMGSWLPQRRRLF